MFWSLRRRSKASNEGSFSENIAKADQSASADKPLRTFLTAGGGVVITAIAFAIKRAKTSLHEYPHTAPTPAPKRTSVCSPTFRKPSLKSPKTTPIPASPGNAVDPRIHREKGIGTPTEHSIALTLPLADVRPRCLNLHRSGGGPIQAASDEDSSPADVSAVGFLSWAEGGVSWPQRRRR